MTMTPFEDMICGRDELRTLIETLEADAAIEAQLLVLLDTPSPVVCYAEAARLIYENRDTLPVEMLQWGAKAAATCSINGFHGMQVEGATMHDELTALFTPAE